MKISKKDILVTSCDLGKNKQDQAYVNLQFIDMEDGMSYQIISKDIDLMNKVKKMTKFKVDLEGLDKEIKQKVDSIAYQFIYTNVLI